MTKFVGKKKANKEEPEKKVEKATEEATTEQINIEQRLVQQWWKPSKAFSVRLFVLKKFEF